MPGGINYPSKGRMSRKIDLVWQFILILGRIKWKMKRQLRANVFDAQKDAAVEIDFSKTLGHAVHDATPEMQPPSRESRYRPGPRIFAVRARRRTALRCVGRFWRRTGANAFSAAVRISPQKKRETETQILPTCKFSRSMQSKKRNKRSRRAGQIDAGCASVLSAPVFKIQIKGRQNRPYPAVFGYGSLFSTRLASPDVIHCLGV